MTLAGVGAAFLWVLIFVYSILGAIDFGSSYWRLHFSLRGRWNTASVASTYVSPTWELINAFLIVIPVALVGLFPDAAFAYGTVLAVPATLLLVLLALRGAYLQFGYASERFRKQMIYVAGITGLLLPGVLIALLPLSQGGYVTRTAHSYALQVGSFFTSVQVYAFIGFGVTLALYLSSLFLARYAQAAGERLAYHRFRHGALWMGPISLLFGGWALAAGHPGAMPLMVTGMHLGLVRIFFGLSLLSFVIGYISLAAQRSDQSIRSWRVLLQLGLGIVQIVTAQMGYAVAHSPYLLYPFLTFSGAAANQQMFVSTLIVLIGGLLLLSPALLWFRRLFLVDAEYVATHVKENH
ncbi:MAG: cytochrome d ubiquinol oxidase subunit II [Firmicutes bacterium]|nr:cytochrome d ubiquinol oxidase subunit II [Bacillota bacterium]